MLRLIEDPHAYAWGCWAPDVDTNVDAARVDACATRHFTQRR